MDRETIARLKAESLEKQRSIINIQGYSKIVECSGDVVCSYFAMDNILITKLIVNIDDYPEKEEMFITINIKSVIEQTLKIPIKSAKNEFPCHQEIKRNDKVLISLEYPNETKKPKEVWVMAIGEKV